MKATIKDIKETDLFIKKRLKQKGSKRTYSEMMEDIMLTYENVTMHGKDCVIRLRNGIHRSIWDYV